jgi:CDP-diacylglycerol--glycerol-3-phosphate 3-phosphatidyltransferase/cardiolipin synthase
MNLPNKLTVLRILLVPVFIILYLTGHYYIATAVFIGASVTDTLDGKIARARGLVTNFGKIMDPLADKILVYSAFVLLVADGSIPGWMLIVILAREFLVAGLRTVAAADGLVIAADMSGKIKTVLQMIAVPLLMIRNWPFSYVDIPMDKIMLWACLVMTVYSGCEYVIKNKHVFSKGGF